MEEDEQTTFGPNMWLVDEMYRRYQENPKAVSESWQEFFEGYSPGGLTPSAPATPERGAPAPPPPTQPAAPEDATPLKGVAARIAENMESSLSIPTATSVRSMPAKLLEENRRIINWYLAARGGKVSFTHLIGWAVLKGLEAHPAMKASFAALEGKPHVIQHKSVNLGLAVDIERSDGQRVLYVPNIKEANDLDFREFWSAYEDAIRKVRSNKLTPEDFAGTTVTLTNPGTIGTRASVPRLMPGQGLIVGVGAIAYPSEYEASDPRALATIGVSKVVTLTSTYDHRVIQGAESGQFLSYVHDLLLGAERFYDEIFASLAIPYEPARWSRDHTTGDGTGTELEKQSRVIRLINMYRVRGHLLADLNPIGWEVLTHPELDLSYNGLTVWDLDREFLTDGLPGPRKMTLRKIIDTLRDAYCRTIGIEYMHISEPDQKNWIQNRVEGEPTDELEREEKLHILDRLNAAESFERFLHAKYTGHKRFSIEGAESVIPMLDAVLESAADDHMIEAVVGMAHRGRLNVLANTVGKPLREIFREFEGDIDPDSVQGSGDVKYHLGMTGRFTSRAGNPLAVVLASNPSHLEAVDPVVEGMARAKQDLLGDEGREQVLPILLHGDAAFAGQGVVAETFNLSQLPGYRTGGTIHIVINNNIGFTTAPRAGRSTTYATDIAKMVQAPILHVNGDDPEACVRVIKLAYGFRKQFAKDIVIDLVCYRRHGHNEGDEPAFTQPLMYAKIDERRSVRKLYTEKLLNRGELTVEEAEAAFEDFRSRMQQAFEDTKGATKGEDIRAASPPVPTGVLSQVETGVERDRLELVHETLTTFPQGFEPHPKLKKMIEKRAGMLDEDAVDWAGAEALAFGSLLLEGFAVRLSGQDARRGTFSQRHSVLVDHQTGEEHFPLSTLSDDQGRFRTHDSLLSEFAVLGFEYGYSLANGDALVCWEAQFGDFINGAQVVVDQFIVAGEDKWAQESGVVLLLPHGYEGQGPEHSSARLERFLTLAAEDSIQVVQPSTAAQYFHVLRRQMLRSVRKPLIVMTPKSLLRAAVARSATSELTDGTFRETIDDDVPAPEDVKRVLLCSGKIAYSLLEQRDELKAPAAIVRLEQLYPFPDEQLDAIFERYENADEIRWVQEEPRNMGGWGFVYSKLARRLWGERKLTVSSRPESASPATGSATIHQQEQDELVKGAFEGL
jgi:multifunctional 2-oxoglutarate metabolism enzyme